VIPGFNADEEELRKMAEFLKHSGIYQVELLPYHAMGSMKYQALGREPIEYSVPEKTEMEEYRKLFDSFGK
jgi:pyruvate formate lyase activating enzyme